MNKRDYMVVLEYINQEGNKVESQGRLSTHKQASKEAARLTKRGHKARVEHVARQSFLLSR